MVSCGCNKSKKLAPIIHSMATMGLYKYIVPTENNLSTNALLLRQMFPLENPDLPLWHQLRLIEQNYTDLYHKSWCFLDHHTIFKLLGTITPEIFRGYTSGCIRTGNLGCYTNLFSTVSGPLFCVSVGPMGGKVSSTKLNFSQH